MIAVKQAGKFLKRLQASQRADSLAALGDHHNLFNHKSCDTTF